MPRYYFNIFDGRDSFDSRGVEFADIHTMRLHMLTTAFAMLSQENARPKTWQMEAIDDCGKIVGTLDFGLACNDGAWMPVASKPPT